jgi:hypothetical protein
MAGPLVCCFLRARPSQPDGKARITDDITLEISTGDVVAALATREGRALGRGHSLHWEV